MKKSVLTLAIAAALTAPLVAQADTILYGSARVSVDYNDDDNVFNDFKGKGAWDVANNASRLGVLGSEDLGGGLSAVYQYEFGVDVTEGSNLEGNRAKFVGLKGGFGTLTVGTHETPYYEVVGINDIFNSGLTFGPSVWLGGFSNGFYYSTKDGAKGGSAGTLEREPNSIYYATPDFNGFSASALMVMGASITINDQTFPTTSANGFSDNVDLWEVALKYSNGPFFAGATYVALNGKDSKDLAKVGVNLDRDQWGLGLGYQSGPFTVGLTYEQGTLNEWGLFQPAIQTLFPNKTIDKPWSAYLTGTYTVGSNVFGAAYGQLDTGLPGVDAIQNYVLSYQYNLSKRTRLWVEYIGRDAEPASLNKKGDFIVSKAGTVFYGDANAVSIGTRVDF